MALASGVALHATYIFIVATILPPAVAEIGGVAYYAWATTLFAVGSIAGAASAASLISRYTARGAYRLGLTLFAAGSLCCAVAPDMAVLVLGRWLQGLGGGMLAALGYALVTALFPDALRARAIALVSGVWGAAALAGPLVGGGLAEMGMWRTAFWVALPLALACGLLIERILPSPRLGETVARSSPRHRFPTLRLALLAGAALALSVGSVPGRVSASLAGLVVGAALLAAVLSLDRRAPQRMLPTGALSMRTLTGALSITMAFLVLSVGTTSFLPYILRLSHGVSPLAAGYVAALSSVAWTLATFAAGTAGPAASRRWIAAGPLVGALGMAGVAAALATGGSVALITGSWTLVGAGIGMGWAHLASLLIGSAAPLERDIAATFITTLQVAALAFSSALAGMAANLAGLPSATTPESVASAGFWLFASFTIFPICAVAAAWRMLTTHAAAKAAGR